MTYTWSEEHQTYAVQAWTEFGIECNSVSSADINVYYYIGEVTWYKKTISTSGGASSLIRIHDKAYCKCVCLFIDYTFAIPLLGEDELAPVVIHILQDNDISSGSGETDMLMESPLTSMLTSTGADIADFTELSSESVDQLYAYRYSNTSVVLGTRSASGLIGDSNEVVQMAIGLSAVADGMYICVCVAENFPHRNNGGISNITVNIQAITCEWQINYKKCYTCTTCPIGSQLVLLSVKLTIIYKPEFDSTYVITSEHVKVTVASFIFVL